MKIKILLSALLTAFMLFSCGEKKNTAPEKRKVTTFSNGRINTINVVMESDQWKGEVGDSLRAVLASPTLGLPTDEPLFSIKQLSEQTFTGFQREKRLILEVRQSDTTGVAFEKNVYAIPQMVVVVSGPDDAAIAKALSENEAQIVATLKAQELNERQRQISKNLQRTDSLEKVMGVSLKFPTAYRYAAQTEDFFWMTKDLKIGEMNIMVYEVPLYAIDKDTNTIARIVRMRDSVGSRKIPVDGGKFITQTDFSPYLQKTTLDGLPAWETRGLWEVDKQSMGGPFVNFAIKDEKRNRYLVLEGFIHSPSLDKRDNMLELDAILKTAKISTPEK